MLQGIGLRDLELVRLVADSGSVTSAASCMHVSQPAASQRLANVQDRLGTRLFFRRDGRMHPTGAGERLVAAACAVARELGSAGDDIAAIVDGGERKLRVTTQCYTCYRWLSHVMDAMRRKHPELVIDVVPEATEDPYRALDDDAVDIAIVSHREPDRGFEERRLFSDELYAVMCNRHPLAKRRFLNPRDFANESLALYSGNRHQFLDEVLHPAGVTPGRLLKVRMTEAIVELARAGSGIAILAGWAFNDLSSQRGLAAVRITRGGIRRTWHAVIGHRCQPGRVDAFVRSVGDIGRAIDRKDWRRKLQDRGAR